MMNRNIAIHFQLFRKYCNKEIQFKVKKVIKRINLYRKIDVPHRHIMRTADLSTSIAQPNFPSSTSCQWQRKEQPAGGAKGGRNIGYYDFSSDLSEQNQREFHQLLIALAAITKPLKEIMHKSNDRKYCHAIYAYQF
nr:hypothetical protein [uncultured Cohaesibacter sp.]